MIELKKSEEYHEDEGGVLFISFSRDENGQCNNPQECAVNIIPTKKID